MENASKALYMAAGVLLAVMLLAVVIIFFKNISTWPEAQDEMLSTKQIAAFNGEYEIYDKSAMYGVDVISCLNKAKSNNEKYAEGENWLGGNAYGKDYYIDVEVEFISKGLDESVELYAVDKNNEVQLFNNYTVTDTKMETVFKDIGNVYSTIAPDSSLRVYNKTIEFLDGKKYTLMNPTTKKPYQSNVVDRSVNIAKKDEFLVNLLTLSKDPKITVRNTKKNLRYYENKEYGWSTAVWKTFLYDFKLKKFKCTGIDYNTDTGLVNKISFKEI